MQVTWKLKPFEALLCTILCGEYKGSVQETERVHAALNTPAFFEWTKSNEIDTTFTHRLCTIKNSSEVPDLWLAAYDAVNKRVSTYLLELDQIANYLAASGISLVALKNSGIARSIYPYPGASPMGDVDVLVKKSHFRQVHQLLVGQGYHFEFRSPLEIAEIEKASESGGAEYWKILPNGEKLWLELQWRPVSGRWIRPDQEPSAEELMARSIPIEGTYVRLLAPEDNLLQVALHTAKHSYVRAPGFRLHLDVERIVRAYPNLDWEIFLERVKRLQVKTAVYFSLVIPHELFGTPIPDKVLAALCPPRWKEALLRSWIQKAGLFNPQEKKFSRIKYILFNLLLYDDLKGVWQGVFPSGTWMQEHYRFQHQWLLPYYHIRRIGNLLFQRLAT